MGGPSAHAVAKYCALSRWSARRVVRSWLRKLFTPVPSNKFGPSEGRDKGMQTEISPYDATGYRDEHERLALQRANIMHLVDLKRGGYSPRRTEMRIGLTGRPRSISILSKSVPPVA